MKRRYRSGKNIFHQQEQEDFDFSLANQTSFNDKIVKEGKTDANGNANVEFTVPATYTNSGALQANFYTTVFDETGRPVSRAASVDVYTQDVFFGIKRDWFYYYPLNQTIKFALTPSIRMASRQLQRQRCR